MQYDSAHLNKKPILSDRQKNTFNAIVKACPLSLWLEKSRNFEEWMVDFVYTSAKIEGNTYDRVDTDNLLRLGITAGGKRYSDAKMLVNLRDGFNTVMQADAKTVLDEDYLCDLHKTLMTELLPIGQQGIVRTDPVRIGASSYRPLSDPLKLKSEMKALLSQADTHEDPFERAIYLHCNLAYLQFFQDGNKRTARLMQTAALVQTGITPLFFQDTLIDQYQRAVVNYYETGSYESYAAFFSKNYEMVAAQMLGEDEAEFTERMQKETPSGHAWTPI